MGGRHITKEELDAATEAAYELFARRSGRTEELLRDRLAKLEKVLEAAQALLQIYPRENIVDGDGNVYNDVCCWCLGQVCEPGCEIGALANAVVAATTTEPAKSGPSIVCSGCGIGIPLAQVPACEECRAKFGHPDAIMAELVALSKKSDEGG
jgi:hypothetical protein